MSTFVRWFVRMWLLFVVCSFVFRLSGVGKDLPWRSLGWVLVVPAIVVLMASFGWEKYRRQKEGYFVETRGGGEDGSVTYDEAGRTLQLYFTRSQHLIYVPTDTKWRDIMPSWARDRKNEIMTRIRLQVGQGWFGRSWSYEETDKTDLLMSQGQQTKTE
jgi:hypothetical protein